jgi:hypothetical protein
MAQKRSDKQRAFSNLQNLLKLVLVCPRMKKKNIVIPGIILEDLARTCL